MYSATPSTYPGSAQQTNNYNAPALAVAAERHHLADTPAANYLRQQGFEKPSPFNALPLPTGWQGYLPIPSQWSDQQHVHQMQQSHRHPIQDLQQLQSLGCSRPVPRRVAPSSGETTVPEATLRAIGVSNDTNASHEAHTDRLDVLISAIDQSEIAGGFGEWEGGDGKAQQLNQDGTAKEPSSHASVNTLQGSPTTSAGLPAQAPPPAPVPSSLCGRPNPHLMNERVIAGAPTTVISSAKPSNPVLLQAAPAAHITPAAPTTTGTPPMLTDALTQLTSNTGRTATDNSAQAIQCIVDILAAYPELVVQLKQLLNQPREPSAFTEQCTVRQRQAAPLPVQYAQHRVQQQHTNNHYMQHRIAGAYNEKESLLRLLQRHQQQQQIGARDGSNDAAAAGAAALRRAQLSAKFQAMQSKVAARQATLQKIHKHMELQKAFAAHIQTANAISLAPPAPPPVRISVAAGTGTSAKNVNQAPSAGKSTHAAASNLAAGPLYGASQVERQEALYHLLAAKLHNSNYQQQQHHQHQQ